MCSYFLSRWRKLERHFLTPIGKSFVIDYFNELISNIIYYVRWSEKIVCIPDMQSGQITLFSKTFRRSQENILGRIPMNPVVILHMASAQRQKHEVGIIHIFH